MLITFNSFILVFEGEILPCIQIHCHYNSFVIKNGFKAVITIVMMVELKGGSCRVNLCLCSAYPGKLKFQFPLSLSGTQKPVPVVSCCLEGQTPNITPVISITLTSRARPTGRSTWTREHIQYFITQIIIDSIWQKVWFQLIYLISQGFHVLFF